MNQTSPSLDGCAGHLCFMGALRFLWVGVTGLIFEMYEKFDECALQMPAQRSHRLKL